jgi:hypothetical protein
MLVGGSNRHKNRQLDKRVQLVSGLFYEAFYSGYLYRGVIS